MPLRLTLGAGELIVVNGCAIRNTDRRQVLTIENRADVVRGRDLISPGADTTPVSRVHLAIQTALIAPDRRDELRPTIQRQLAALAAVLGARMVRHVFDAAHHVSAGDYYRALVELRPLHAHERCLLRIGSSDDADGKRDRTLTSPVRAECGAHRERSGHPGGGAS